MKNKIQYSLFISLVFMFSSCMREEQRLFPESAALRMNHAVDNAKSVLIAQSDVNGWIMEYFPTNATEGYTFLMSFKSNTFVTIAGRNQYMPTYTTDSSAYEVIGDMGPVLTFDTYNKIFHLFSNPVDPSGGNLGNGLLGDYEFIIMNISSGNEITLQGKKRGTAILMHPLAQGQDWKGYFDLLDSMNTTIFNSKIPVMLTLQNSNEGDSIYYLKNGATHIFTAIAQNATDASAPGNNIPFIITDYGLRFAQPFAMGVDSVQSFKLSDDKNELVCTDEGKNAKITGPDLVSFYFDTTDANNMQWVMLSGPDYMSPAVQTIYNKMTQSFAGLNAPLSQIAFRYATNGGDMIYITTTKNQYGSLFFDKTQIPEGVQYLFKNTFGAGADNGRAFYNSCAGVADLMALFSSAFKIDYANSTSRLIPSYVKLTDVSNPNVWFVLKVQ